MATVSKQATESISERLCVIENLYFPTALQSKATSPSLRKSLLLDLLSRNVPVFLERYGSMLNSQELQEFEVLRDDYEISWHLKHLQSLISPTSQQLRSRSLAVKNRRRAYMNKLIMEGDYFSEDDMRERDPYLHYEYVGKFQDPIERAMARPGERWSDTLLRRAEEDVLVAKIRTQQQRLGVAEKDWVGNDNDRVNMEEQEQEEEEEEEDEDSEEDKAMPLEVPQDKIKENCEEQSDTTVGVEEDQSLSAAEMQDQLDQFTSIMQQKFLAGEDQEYQDYAKIDEDETLDDHWLSEANHDAEEKYFAED